MKRVITAKDVEEAHKKRIPIRLNSGNIVTPYARDRAKQLDVVFEKETNPEERPIKIPIEGTVTTVAIAADHGGFYLKEDLKNYIQELGFKVIDLGPSNADPCDYPDYAFKVAESVSEGIAQRGVMIDSVGIGSAMAANRVPGILAAKCNNVVEAKSAREHNYANVLTLGAKMIGNTMAREIVQAFLTTKGGAERHQRRIQKILNYQSEKK